MTNPHKQDDSKKLVLFKATLHLDGPTAGQTIETPDEELAVQQGVTVEQLRDARAKVLARVYALILSWPDPT